MGEEEEGEEGRVGGGEGEGVGGGVGIFLSGRREKKRGIGSLLIGDKGGGTDSFLDGGVFDVLTEEEREAGNFFAGGSGVGDFLMGNEGGGEGGGVGIFLSGSDGKNRGMGSLLIGGRGGGTDSFRTGGLLDVSRDGGGG